MVEELKEKRGTLHHELGELQREEAEITNRLAAAAPATAAAEVPLATTFNPPSRPVGGKAPTPKILTRVLKVFELLQRLALVALKTSEGLFSLDQSQNRPAQPMQLDLVMMRLLGTVLTGVEVVGQEWAKAAAKSVGGQHRVEIL